MYNPFYYSNFPFTNIPNSFYSLNRTIRNIPIRPSFNFNSLIENAQKGINTINQIIPLYKQIKPIYSQAKNTFQSASKLFKKFQRSIPNSNLNNETTFTKKQSNSNYTNYQTNSGPSSPFFY